MLTNIFIYLICDLTQVASVIYQSPSEALGPGRPVGDRPKLDHLRRSRVSLVYLYCFILFIYTEPKIPG